MIFHIDGSISIKTEDYLVVDVNGVGYQVFVPSTLIDALPGEGNSVKLFTVHIVREDSQTLYGFMKKENRDFFILLTSVSGIGPKVGLKILSAVSPAQLVEAIMKDDLLTITSCPGVGKKMGERMIVELRDKLPTHLISRRVSVVESSTKVVEKHDDDLFQALKTLGYSQEEIRRSYHKSAIELTPDMTLEEGIKVLLKHMA